MHKFMLLLGLTAAAAFSAVQVSAAETAAAAADSAAADAALEEELPELPCPTGWSVENNPSVENSLSYLHEGGDLAVNITYVAGSAGNGIEPESYARVAAEQLDCTLPVRSNLIDKAWSFECEQSGVEAIVYGQAGNLVLLSISGRNDDTESALEDFVRFLAYQSKRG
ncbi:MAG: hypothetical protein IAB19_00860 [Proteobacteria bacterium]|uniref:Uncharacterized protein n=1 Tax=Candidatus Avisuccinivibrio stercorigallinarum TaxID=2840704 RepID=A0A9D9D829_9GAMM|nr:hypothetical protein [Candidatus Avisuccinivibrio stercorigallinarum]